MLSVFQVCKRATVLLCLFFCVHCVVCQASEEEKLIRNACQTVGFEMKALVVPKVAENEVVTDGFDCSITCASEVSNLRSELSTHRFLGISMLKARKWDFRPKSFALDECVFALRYCVQSWEEFVSAVHVAECPAAMSSRSTKECSGAHCNTVRSMNQPDCTLAKVFKAGLSIYKCLCTTLTIVPKMRRKVPTGYPVPTQRPDAAEFCSHSEICKRLSDKFTMQRSNWWCHGSAAIVERENCQSNGQLLQPCPCVVKKRAKNWKNSAAGIGCSKRCKDQCKDWSRSSNAMALLLARPASAAASFEIVDLPPDHTANRKQGWTSTSEYNPQSPGLWQSFNIDDLNQMFPETNTQGAFSNHKFRERGQPSGQPSDVLVVGAKRMRKASSSTELSAIQMLGEALDLHLQGQKQVDPLDVSSTKYDGQAVCSEPMTIFTEMASISSGAPVDTDEIDALIKSTSNFIDELPGMLNNKFIIESDALHRDATQCSINDVSSQSAEIGRKRKQKQLEQGESSTDASQSFRPLPAAGIHLANVADLDPGYNQQQLVREVSSQTSFAMTANSLLINVDLGSLTSVDTNTDEHPVLNEKDIEQILDSIKDPFTPWL